MPSRDLQQQPPPHPFRRRLSDKFPSPLSRSCGYPGCDQRLTVDLFAPETHFRGAAYCPGHQGLANKRRKQLRNTISDIDTLLNSSGALPRAPKGAPQAGLNVAELTQWRRRLQWELDGIPNN